MGFCRERCGRLAVVFLIASAWSTVLAVSALAAPVPELSTADKYREAQEYMLMLINSARQKEGLAPVRLDTEASHVAESNSRDMLANDYFSHWNMQGLKPTRRWNLSGGYDALSENIYYQYGMLAGTRELMDEAMDKFMHSEGHRRTIMTPEHTHVGLGFAVDLTRKRFYVSQEFVTRLGGTYDCPLKCRVGERVPFTGRFDTSRYSLENVIVGYEELPQPRDRKWLSKTGEYSDSDKLVAGYSPDTNIRFNSLDTYHDLKVAQDGSFHCDALLDFKGREGLYYLFVWLKEKHSGDSVLAAVATVEARK